MVPVHITFLHFFRMLPQDFISSSFLSYESNDFIIQEKEDWINAIGRSIVRHSRSVTDEEVLDYDSKRAS